MLRQLIPPSPWWRTAGLAVFWGSLSYALPLGQLAQAAPIGSRVTFETLADGATLPTDNSPLPPADEYELNNGVRLRFSFLDNATGLFTFPGHFEARGVDDLAGFISTHGVLSEDSGRPGVDGQLGDYFLRSPAELAQSGGPLTLRIDYVNNLGMHYAAGQIWDIDSDANGTEQWQVSAYGFADVLIGSATSPIGLTPAEGSATPELDLDSRPWQFELETHGEMAYLLIDFIGTKQIGRGLAFDNFVTAAERIPEPSSLALWTNSVMLIFARSRRR